MNTTPRTSLTGAAMAPVVAALLGAGTLACNEILPPKSQFPTADDAFARMKASYACVNGVQGQAKIDTLSKQGRVRGDVYILTQNADKVRFEVVSPFGPMIFLLTSDGKEFRYLDVKNKQFVFGPPKACNLARMTQVPVPAHALVSLLRGEAPLLVHTPEQASIAWDGQGGFYKLIIDSKNSAKQEVHLQVRPQDVDKPWSEQRVRVLDVNVKQMGIDLFNAELRNHVPVKTSPPRVDEDGLEDPIPPTGGVCDAELPLSLHITVPNTDQDVIFQYKSKDKDVPVWNPPIIDGAFTQPQPGGVTSGFADCSDVK